MLLFLAALFFQETSNPVVPSSSLDQVRAFFSELPDQAFTKLWQTEDPPQIMVLDSDKRIAFTKVSPGKGLFAEANGIWYGILPQGPSVEGSLLNWAGQTWLVMPWPLPATKWDQLSLWTQKAWIRHAQSLGFPHVAESMAHLKTIEGRIWMRLEWQALRKALTNTGLKQRAAVADALCFRRHRRGLSEKAAFEELQVELSNGLGAYTALTLANHKDPREWLVGKMARHSADEDYTHAFAALSGPAFGLLLDEHRPNWRQKLNSHQDLALMLEVGMKLILPKAWYDAAQLRADVYQVAKIRHEETERAAHFERLRAEYRQTFVQQPVLGLPIDQPGLKVDLKQAFSLGADGWILPSLALTQAWGTLKATKGVRLASDQSVVYLTLPFEEMETGFRGDGWILALTEEWEIGEALTLGDLAVTQKPEE